MDTATQAQTSVAAADRGTLTTSSFEHIDVMKDRRGVNLLAFQAGFQIARNLRTRKDVLVPAIVDWWQREPKPLSVVTWILPSRVEGIGNHVNRSAFENLTGKICQKTGLWPSEKHTYFPHRPCATGCILFLKTPLNSSLQQQVASWAQEKRQQGIKINQWFHVPGVACRTDGSGKEVVEALHGLWVGFDTRITGEAQQYFGELAEALWDQLPSEHLYYLLNREVSVRQVRRRVIEK